MQRGLSSHLDPSAFLRKRWESRSTQGADVALRNVTGSRVPPAGRSGDGSRVSHQVGDAVTQLLSPLEKNSDVDGRTPRGSRPNPNPPARGGRELASSRPHSHCPPSPMECQNQRLPSLSPPLSAALPANRRERARKRCSPVRTRKKWRPQNEYFERSRVKGLFVKVRGGYRKLEGFTQ